MHYHYFTLEQRQSLERQIRTYLNGPALDRALERLRSPEYGICGACGADIPFRRLIASPLERRCPDCR